MKFEIRNLKFGFAAVALLLATGCEKAVPPLPAEGFIAQASLSTNVIHVGDPVTLTLTARHPTGSAIHFPDIASRLQEQSSDAGNDKKIVVSGRASDNKTIAEGIQQTEETYRLTSFRTGDWTVSTNPVTCTFADGTEKSQALPELILHVQSLLNETNANKISDIKDIVKPPMHISPKLWVPLLIALLAIIAGVITLLFLRKPRTILQMAPPQPPQVIARQALAALKRKDWIPEPFFTELSLILRTYLENRFDINAPESTTEELTRSMSKDVRLNIKEQQTLNHFLTQADMVKFARADAEKQVMETAFETVEHFVDQTEPVEEDNHLEPQKNTENAKGDK